MTMWQVGETGIKLIGLYYVASTLFGVAGLLAGFLMPQTEALPSASELFLLPSVGVVADATVAALYLFGGRRLAAAVFSDEPIVFGGLPRREWLFVGISLIGLSWILSGASAILDGIGKVIWFSEASRQPMLEETIRRSSADLIRAVLSVLVGVAVILSARTLVRWLDREA